MNQSLLTRAFLILFFAFTAVIVPMKASAQTDPDEAYDPFSDYSEFDEASDEEADINFFRNGRLMTVGLAVGPRIFSGGMAKSYGDGPAMGVFLSYFFDMQLAMSLGLTTGDHSVKLPTTNKTYTGNVSFNEVNFHLKYYISTQNLVKGLANINPYIIGGFSQVSRSYTIAELLTKSKETLMSTDAGLGIEIPLMRKKAFIGLQALYHFANFTDEGKATVNGTDPLKYKIDGDYMNLQAILGMNF